MVIVAFGLCLITSLVFGWLPAMRFSRPVIISSLKDDAGGGGGLRVGRVHRVTAALQVAIAVPLLVMSGQSLDRVRATATSDLGFASECLHAFGADFKVFVGLEELSFPMMAVGACGLMNAVGNLCPAVLAKMCDAVLANDLAAGRELHDQLLEINKAVFFDTNPIPMKYMMKKLGLLENNEHRLPMMSATPELAAKLDGVLERAGL